MSSRYTEVVLWNKRTIHSHVTAAMFALMNLRILSADAYHCTFTYDINEKVLQRQFELQLFEQHSMLQCRDKELLLEIWLV